MKPIKINHKGFTLTESLVVLMIVSIMLMVGVSVTKNSKDELAVRHFLNRLDRQILLNHQASFVEEQLVWMGREPESRTISFVIGEQKFSLPIPEVLHVSYFPTMNFSKGTGNSKNMHSFSVYWNEKNLEVSYDFLFGKGHYERTVKYKP